MSDPREFNRTCPNCGNMVTGRWTNRKSMEEVAQLNIEHANDLCWRCDQLSMPPYVAAEEIMHTYYSEGEHKFLKRVETTYYFTNDMGTVFVDMTDPANPVHNYAS